MTNQNSLYPEEYELSNLVLWRKGWYESTDEDDDLFDIFKKLLKEDGYTWVFNLSDALTIITGSFDRYCKWRKQHNLSTPDIQQLYISAKHIQDFTNEDFEMCLALSILEYLAYVNSSEIKFKKPHFDHNLYKRGLKFPNSTFNGKKGVTYKDINKHVDTYKW